MRAELAADALAYEVAASNIEVSIVRPAGAYPTRLQENAIRYREQMLTRLGPLDRAKLELYAPHIEAMIAGLEPDRKLDPRGGFRGGDSARIAALRRAAGTPNPKCQTISSTCTATTAARCCLLSTLVSGFEGHDGRVRAVATSAGPIEAQLAVIGIGVIPNDQLARQSGLDTDKGIVVDLTGRTSNPHIYSIGDCCHLAHTMHNDLIRLESVQNAVDQAKLVAAAIIGKPVDYSVVPWFWSDQYDVKLQIAGIAEPGHERLHYHDPEAGTLAVHHFAAGRLRAAETVNRAGDHMSAHRLIAAPAPPTRAEVENAGGALKGLLKRG